MIQQPKGFVNNINLSKPSIEAPKNIKNFISGMGQLQTMRKNNSVIHISQRVVSNKENLKESMNIINAKPPSKTITKNQMIHKQPQNDQEKLQQLKNRFRKIKSNFQQNHNKIICDTIRENEPNYNVKNGQQQNYGFRSNETTKYGDRTEFNISSQQQMDRLQQIRKNEYEISFQKENDLCLDEQNKKQDRFVEYYAGQNGNDIKEKYRSLTRQLTTFDQSQVIDLLIEQIQDNEKNKQIIERLTCQLQQNENQNNELRNQLQKVKIQSMEKIQSMQRAKKEMQQFIKNNNNNLKNTKEKQEFQNLKQKNADLQKSLRKASKQVEMLQSEISKQKKEIQNKRQQIQILLETEKKNLSIIEKLKGIKRQQNKISIQKLGQINPLPVFQQISEMKTTGQKRAEIDYKVKHDELEQYMKEYISNVNEAHEEYKRNLNELKETNCKLKEQCNKQRIENDRLRLKQAGNLSIKQRLDATYLPNNAVSAVQNVGNKPLQQAKSEDMNEKAQQKFSSLQSQLIRVQSENSWLHCQNVKLRQKLQLVQSTQCKTLRSQIQKLTTCISNSKLVITELQEEFSSIKDENQQLRQINRNNIQLINVKEQLIETIKRELQTVTKRNANLQKELNILSVSNERLLNQNQQLIKETAQIQSKIQTNSRTQTEIRTLIQELTLSKHQQQLTIQKYLNKITQLEQQLAQKDQQIKNKNSQLTSIQENYSEIKQQLEKKQKQAQQLNKNVEKIKLSEKKLHETQKQKLRKQIGLIKKSNLILQETICQMTQLITDLLSEHKILQQQNTFMEAKIYEIKKFYNKTKAAFEWEAAHKEAIKDMLNLYWQKQNQSNNLDPNKQKKVDGPKGTYIQGHINDEINEAEENLQESQKQEEQSSGQISFKKGSLMTKQGSSSVFNKMQANENMKSKSSLSKNQSVQMSQSEEIQSSAISHKYYSETDEDMIDSQSFGILKNSNITNIKVTSNQIKSNSRKMDKQTNFNNKGKGEVTGKKNN